LVQQELVRRQSESAAIAISGGMDIHLVLATIDKYNENQRTITLILNEQFSPVYLIFV